MPIQWYPGHMTKAKRMMTDHIGLVDVVIELLDARIPRSSKNPDIDKMAAHKRRVVVLNKADLADPAVTAAWEAYYRQAGQTRVLPIDSRNKKNTARLVDAARAVMSDKIERERLKGRVHVPIRAMVVGIPNVGKSTFINQLAGGSPAAASDRPGVTRGRQWITVKDGLILLDTPGVLWPKFEDEAVGIRLAATGAIADDVVDSVSLCEALIAILNAVAPDALVRRYKLAHGAPTQRDCLTAIGAARGFVLKGGVIDLKRAADTVLDEFRGGKLGRISLEQPDI